MTAEQKVTRKLRAILSADVKGYSLLMEQDETSTIQKLNEYRHTMSEIIQHNTGHVVDAVGDNLLAEFSSAVEAVQCAVNIQKDLKEKNKDVPVDSRLEFRIGINIGDVVHEGDRIYGSGVNVAARIEGLAEPGGICISRNAYDQIKGKLNLGYQYLGDHEVKNIKDPVYVYKVLLDSKDAGKVIGGEPKPLLKTLAWSTVIVAGIIFIAYLFHQQPTTPEFEPASIEKIALPLPEKPSIAVLAFDNMTGDKEQEYFSDGLAEEIITALASVPELFVIARNSSFTYKGKPVKVQQISEELGVRYVLEGSVRKSGDRVRITAQLIDAFEGHHLWADTYDRNIEDLFAVQDEITMKILEDLEIKLIGNQLRAPCSKNLKAYLKFLKAAGHWSRSTKEDNDIAQRLAEEAIALDPDYACAYSLLGMTHWDSVVLGSTRSPEESIATAKKMNDKAIELNPSLVGPQCALTYIYIAMGKHEEAIVQAKEALAINPDSELANGAMGYVLIFLGRSKEAIPFYQKATRNDPFSTRAHYGLGVSYFLSGKNKEAIEACQKAINNNPDNLRPQCFLAAAYSAAGLIEKAGDTASVILKMNPKFTLEKFAKTLRLKNPADKELVINHLLRAGLPENPPLPLPEKPSIAVLAFDNMSGDPEQEYFSDGISEDIITTLSKSQSLFVIARNSTFRYKGQSVNIQKIAKELGVRYVLEGSVRKSEDRVRVTAQLIDAVAGNHLWAERYDRDIKDIFALQDEITLKIVRAMQVSLTEGDQAWMWRKSIQDLDVKLKFLKAWSLWAKGTEEDLVRFGEVAKELIEMAPDSGIGYRCLAWHYWGLAIIGKSPLEESMKKALQLAQKAFTLDKSDPFIYPLLSNLYAMIRQYDKAIIAGKKGVTLLPNGAHNHCAFGITLSFSGKPDEAIDHLNKAIRLDPFPEYYYFTHLGRCYMHKGKYERALSEFKKAHYISPENPSVNWLLAAVYALLDKQEEAEAAAKKVLKIEPKFSVDSSSKGWPYKNQADTNFIANALRKAGLPD